MYKKVYFPIKFGAALMRKCIFVILFDAAILMCTKHEKCLGGMYSLLIHIIQLSSPKSNAFLNFISEI